jgi:two-component system OmpR family response regulator
MVRVLVVEDDRKLRANLVSCLRAEGYEVAGAATGEEGLRLALDQSFDCLVLDRMLPVLGGLEVLAALRRAGKTLPVLILTARDAVEDRVEGLDAGADDYLVKPFAIAELLARLRVLLRRDRPERETVLRADDLKVDLLERTARRGAEEIKLSQREFDVLVYLLRHKNATVTRAMLGRDVWKEADYHLTNVIDVYVNQLRRKLESPGRQPIIHTIRGVGYRLGEAMP